MKKVFILFTLMFLIVFTGCNNYNGDVTNTINGISEQTNQPTSKPTIEPSAPLFTIKNEMSCSLYEAIQAYLGTDEEITLDMLEGIYELDLYNKEVTSIRGIEYCQNLNSLNLNRNMITDISPLGKLTSLEILFMPGYETGGEAFLELINLKELDFRGIRYEDYKYLKNLNKLEMILCRSLQNVEGLMEFSSLKTLKIEGGNNDDYENTIKTLDHFSKTNTIEELYLYDCDVEISDLSAYYDIKTLLISDYGYIMTDTELLSNFEHLESLTLYELYLGEWESDEDKKESSSIALSTINELTNLKKLIIGYCPTYSISEISDLKNLEYLSLEYTGIDDISVVKNFKKLKYLNIRDHLGITDLTMLEDLDQLETLEMYYCHYAELDNLTGNNSIKSLNISCCDWEDYSFLEKWVNLEVLDISCNDLQNIDVLLEIPHLKKVDISNNPIVNGEEIISQLEAQGVEVIR